MQSVLMLNVFKVAIIILGVFMLSVIMLSVVAPGRHLSQHVVGAQECDKRKINHRNFAQNLFYHLHTQKFLKEKSKQFYFLRSSDKTQNNSF